MEARWGNFWGIAMKDLQTIGFVVDKNFQKD